MSRLKKKPGEKGSPVVDRKQEMANSETTGASPDVSRLQSDFKTFKQAFKKPFAGLGQKASSQSLENLSAPTIKSGWLFKQGGVVKSWNSRWFMLKGNQLFYYANKDENKLLGTINLDGNKVESLQLSEPCRFPFQVVPGGSRSRLTLTHETYQLQSSTEDDRNAWIDAIRGAAGASTGGSPAVMRKDVEQVPPIFGQELDETMEYESKTSNRKVPQIVEQCVDYLLKYGLETEGIFRLPGRALIVKQLKEQFDKGERPVFTMPDMDVHSVASLLKMFLRDLPQPLVTVELYDVVIILCTRAVAANPETTVETLGANLTKLPRHNYNLLQYVCHFLDEVSQRSSVNKMTVMNLSTIFVQSVIRPLSDKPEELMGTLSARTMVVHLLVTKWREIFKMEYNHQGDLVQVDTLIDLGTGSNTLKKFSARTSVHPQNANFKTASTLFDFDMTPDLMQPLEPVATSERPAPVIEETEEDEIYDTPKPTNNTIHEEFETNMNGSVEEEEDTIYDVPLPRTPLEADLTFSAPSVTDLPVSEENAVKKSLTISQSAENITSGSLTVPSLNQKRLSAPSLRPMVPPRPNKWRHAKQTGDRSDSLRARPLTEQDASHIQDSDSDHLKPALSNMNSINSLNSITDSGHQSESDSTGDGTQSPNLKREKAIANALRLDVLPLSSLSTIGSSSGSQQSVGSDPQDVKLCEISSSDGSSFSLNDVNQDDMLLGATRRDLNGNDDSLHMSLSCGNKAAARRSRASLMGVPAPSSSPTLPDKARSSIVSTISESSNEKSDNEDQHIQELTEKDVSSLSQEDLIAHVSTLCTELKLQRIKTKTLSSKLVESKEKSAEKVQNLAKQLDKERNATSHAVERVMKLQAQLRAYQLNFGELNESVYGNTSFYG